VKTKIYDIKLQFSLVKEDTVEVCSSPQGVVNYMQGAFDTYPEQESFWVVALNRKNFPKGRQMISLGSQTATVAQPLEVFRSAVLMGATAIVVVHNHPSGDPAPSSADFQITRKLREAGKVLDIEMLDHIIIGDVNANPMGKSYYSFREVGVL